MNCLEFRRRLSVDPNDRDIEFQRHARECSACAAHVRNRSSFERHLRAAMDVPVPENLASRILLHQSMAVERAPWIRRAGWFALAASVLMVVGMATAIWTTNSPEPMARLVLRHIEEEPHSLSAHQNMQLARVNEMLRPFGATVTGAFGRVDYLSICHIRKTTGAHLVVKESKGLVTVLIMPGEYVHERIPIRNERFQGVIVPTPNGSMAIIAEHDKPFIDAESRVLANVRFSL